MAEQYMNKIMRDSEHNDAALTGTKADELAEYSQDDIAFLQQVIPPVRQRLDGMIEFPLPFKQPNPTFPYNRKVAFERTKNTLNNMRKKHPEVFQSSLDKFSKNMSPAGRFSLVQWRRQAWTRLKRPDSYFSRVT